MGATAVCAMRSKDRETFRDMRTAKRSRLHFTGFGFTVSEVEDMI